MGLVVMGRAVYCPFVLVRRGKNKQKEDWSHESWKMVGISGGGGGNGSVLCISC